MRSVSRAQAHAVKPCVFIRLACVSIRHAFLLEELYDAACKEITRAKNISPRLRSGRTQVTVQTRENSGSYILAAYVRDATIKCNSAFALVCQVLEEVFWFGLGLVFRLGLGLFLVLV